MSAKKNENINEEMMMKLMVDGVKKEGLSVARDLTDVGEEQDAEFTEKTNEASNISKEKIKIRKQAADYEKIFLKKSDTNARDGKTAYIRPEFHEKLSRIVNVIGEDKLSIYSYIDNVLEHHFQEFGEQIIKSFNDKYKPIL
ncbi:DUF3408 domain-containing protein [Pedobacter sp. KLB.chiD]|uniref:DUF3408 domain-containing protein n=1 Tax=Pedobacter sp. KLB.chiD TaxID=3387402 RepID=UPI00399B5E78